MIALVEGDIALARVVRAFSEGRLKRTRPALRTSELGMHADFESDAPLRGFFRGPYPGASDVVVHSALSGVAAVTPRNGELHLKAQAVGLWPDLPDLSERMTLWATETLRSREMRALGWAFPTEAPQIICAPLPQEEESEEPLVSCKGSGSWSSPAIAEALYRIVAAPTSAVTSDERPNGWVPEELPPPEASESAEP
jgi:hypothetical protein